MPDEIDGVSDRLLRDQSAREDAVRIAAASIPQGAPGECDECGEAMPRLVNGRCAPCRDGRGTGWKRTASARRAASVTARPQPPRSASGGNSGEDKGSDGPAENEN